LRDDLFDTLFVRRMTRRKTNFAVIGRTLRFCQDGIMAAHMGMFAVKGQV
jgi:hypothetical protein